MEGESAGSLPRNRQQVSNFKRTLAENKESRKRNVQGTRDELAAVMEMCLNQSHVPEMAFVRKVQVAPDTMCVLSTDSQLRELERNATNPASFKIVSVDPTFNLGNFDVTVMTYEHGLVINKRTGKHPIVMGPVLVHKCKQFSNYHCFMSSLVELRPSLSKIQFFGTDGETALQQGLSKPCPNSKLLRCFSHFKTNIKEKMTSFQNKFIMNFYATFSATTLVLRITKDSLIQKTRKFFKQNLHHFRYNCCYPSILLLIYSTFIAEFSTLR